MDTNKIRHVRTFLIFFNLFIFIFSFYLFYCNNVNKTIGEVNFQFVSLDFFKSNIIFDVFYIKILKTEFSLYFFHDLTNNKVFCYVGRFEYQN